MTDPDAVHTKVVHAAQGRSRRWFQVSLKSLFLLTLVVAAFFSGMNAERRLAEQAMQEALATIPQSRAVRQIESLGGRINFDGGFRLDDWRHTSYPASDEEAASSRVTGLSFSGTQMNDQGFRLFRHISKKAGLQEVERLSIAGTHVADASVLSDMTQLYWLDIRGTQIRDLSPLHSLTHLGVLYMDGLRISPEAVAELRKALPSCAIYHAAAYDGPSPAAMRGIELP